MKPVITRAPAPPQVLGRSELPICPQTAIAQAQWLGRNMARVRLGFNKLQVVGLLGDPAHAETFSLTNGAAVEVLFYHTPETICRINAREGAARGELMPMVFQDDRLLGYGPNYYKGFIVPMMRPMAVQAPPGAATGGEQGVPQQRVRMMPAQSLPPAPARTGRLVQEDLPTPMATPQPEIYRMPPVTGDQNGYTAPMQSYMRPVGYSSQAGGPEIGRGEPLR